jgi:hypothetical protein
LIVEGNADDIQNISDQSSVFSPKPRKSVKWNEDEDKEKEEQRDFFEEQIKELRVKKKLIPYIEALRKNLQ